MSALVFLRKLPREIWYALALLGLLAGLWLWHTSKVDDAYVAGAAAQAQVDTIAVKKAAVAAAAKQDKTIADLTAKQTKINQERDHALTEAHGDIDRLAAALKLRHEAKTNPGGARRDKAAAVPSPARLAADAACAAGGWLSFDSSLLMATDAEHDAAQLRELQAWVIAQQKAWPE